MLLMVLECRWLVFDLLQIHHGPGRRPARDWCGRRHSCRAWPGRCWCDRRHWWEQGRRGSWSHGAQVRTDRGCRRRDHRRHNRLRQPSGKESIVRRKASVPTPQPPTHIISSASERTVLQEPGISVARSCTSPTHATRTTTTTPHQYLRTAGDAVAVGLRRDATPGVVLDEPLDELGLASAQPETAAPELRLQPDHRPIAVRRCSRRLCRHCRWHR